MSNENRSISPAPRSRRSGITRRSVLSMIPAALLAGWRGLALRSKVDSIPTAGPATQMPITPDGYSYVAAEIPATDLVEPVTGDCCTLWTTVYVYDEQGRIVQQRTVLPDGSTTYHQYEAAQAEA